MNNTISKLIFRLWPFSFGHVSLMELLNPSDLKEQTVTSKLRGYPVSIQYNPNSYIGKYIYYRGVFEESIVNKMAEVLKPGMTFVDIGANIGQHTLIAASIVGAEGKVISFEPQELCRKTINNNLALNNFQNVTLIGCALGESEKEGKIYHVNNSNDGQATLTPDKESDSFEDIEIRTFTKVMNEMSVSNVDVIKIDIEGAELQMLKGGEEFIDMVKPKVIFIECVEEHLNRFGASSVDLMQWFKDKGYMINYLSKGGWSEIQPGVKMNGDLMMTLN